MADYWAHYTTRFRKADGSHGESWTDTYPVIGHTDVALVLNGDGKVLTVEELRTELAGTGGPDEEGETFTVTFEVNPWDGEGR